MHTRRWTPLLAGVLLMGVALGCDLDNPPTAPPITTARTGLADRDRAVPTATAVGATFTSIDVPAATFTEALDITARGDIVGRYSTSDGKNHGYLLHNGTFTTIDVGPTYTVAMGLNARGDVVGQYQDADGRFHGFRVRDGQSTVIDVPDAVASRAFGINDRGDIVGAFCHPACPPTAFRADLGNHGFLLHEGQFTTIDYPEALVTEPFRINGEGDIVGRYQRADLSWHAFLLRHGEFVSIDAPGAIETASFPPPVGINDAGDVVGSYCFAVPCPVRITDNLTTLAHVRGFVVARDGGSFASLAVPQAIATAAYAINAHGDIVGAYVDANHKVHGFLRSAEREPVPVAGTFQFTLEPGPSRQVDGNTVTDFTFREQVFGTVAGVRVGTGTLVTHPDGTIEVQDSGLLSGTVAGVAGSAVVEVRATGTLQSFTARARFVSNSGTGGLKGLSGTVRVAGGATGPTTLAGSYEGQVRFAAPTDAAD